MDIKECLNGCLSRLYYGIEYVNESGNTCTINAVCSGESNQSYACEVEILYAGKKEEYGSCISWDRNDSWIIGDGSRAYLAVKDKKLVLIQVRYNTPEMYSECAEWPDNPQISKEICSLEQIVKMTLETSSGWRGECYRERTYNLKQKKWADSMEVHCYCPECGAEIEKPYIQCPNGDWKEYFEDQWVCILHRSTGAVTIERVFPFPTESHEWEEIKTFLAEPQDPEGNQMAPQANEQAEEPEIIRIEGSDEARRQVNGVWQHMHGDYKYWHPMARTHKESKK